MSPINEIVLSGVIASIEAMGKTKYGDPYIVFTLDSSSKEVGKLLVNCIAYGKENARTISILGAPNTSVVVHGMLFRIKSARSKIGELSIRVVTAVFGDPVAESRLANFAPERERGETEAVNIEDDVAELM